MNKECENGYEGQKSDPFHISLNTVDATMMLFKIRNMEHISV